MPLRRHPLVMAVLGFCLLALTASAPGRPVLGDPLWTGSVSLNGFTLGPDSVYVARPSGVDPGRPELTITLVRDGTGERIAQTAGETYLSSADGRLVLVFSQRFRDPAGCAAPDTICMDVTA